MVGVFERVYEVGPVFRAEPHDTARHLAEYVSLDAEMGFIADHRDVMAVLRSTSSPAWSRPSPSAPARRSTLLELAARRASPRHPRRSPSGEAQQMIERATGARRVGEPDLAPADERWLGEWARSRARLRVRVRHRLPDGQAAVLHPPGPGPTRRVSNSFDLLFRGLELVTGGQRLHRYDDYLARSTATTSRRSTATSKPSATACRRTAASPSASNAGSRAVTGAANIREVTLFPAT